MITVQRLCSQVPVRVQSERPAHWERLWADWVERRTHDTRPISCAASWRQAAERTVLVWWLGIPRQGVLRWACSPLGRLTHDEIMWSIDSFNHRLPTRRLTDDVKHVHIRGFWLKNTEGLVFFCERCAKATCGEQQEKWCWLPGMHWENVNSTNMQFSISLYVNERNTSTENFHSWIFC